MSDFRRDMPRESVIVFHSTACIDLTSVPNMRPPNAVSITGARRTTSISTPPEVIDIEDDDDYDIDDRRPEVSVEANEVRIKEEDPLRKEIEAKFEDLMKGLKTDNDKLKQLLDSKKNVDVALEENLERLHNLETEMEVKERELSQLKEQLVELDDKDKELEASKLEILMLKEKLEKSEKYGEEQKLLLEQQKNENKKLKIEKDLYQEDSKRWKDVGTSISCSRATIRIRTPTDNEEVCSNGGVEMKVEPLVATGRKKNKGGKKDSKTLIHLLTKPIKKQVKGQGCNENHQLEHYSTVKVYRCSCGQRFTRKPSFQLHLKRYNGGATWRCPKEECGDVFYTEYHFKAHTCKALRGIDLGHPMTWKNAHCLLPYVPLNQGKVGDEDYVKWRINQNSSE